MEKRPMSPTGQDPDEQIVCEKPSVHWPLVVIVRATLGALAC